jgi:hypothetical protein
MFTTHTDERARVIAYLREIMPDVGAGEDPVGFLIASHAALADRIATMNTPRAPKMHEHPVRVGPFYRHGRAQSFTTREIIEVHSTCPHRCGSERFVLIRDRVENGRYIAPPQRLRCERCGRGVDAYAISIHASIISELPA